MNKAAKIKQLNKQIDDLLRTRAELVKYRNSVIDHPIKYWFRNWNERFRENEIHLDHIDSKLYLLYLEMQKYE